MFETLTHASGYQVQQCEQAMCLLYNRTSDLRKDSLTRRFLCLDIYKRQEFFYGVVLYIATQSHASVLSTI
jgi:hypothetical protein